MKVVYNWLKDFVEVNATVQDLARASLFMALTLPAVEADRLAG